MSLQSILVGVDDSPGSCAAVEWVVELAAALDATVVAAHAFEPLGHLEEIEPGTAFADIRDAIEQKLRSEWCRPLIDAGVRVETVVKEGRPADVIIAVAREIEVDLIVLGARRMGRIREFTLGSTSQRVIHEARRPVTVLHAPDA